MPEQYIGRLWIRTEVEGKDTPLTVRQSWEDVCPDLPEGAVPPRLREDQMSILTDAGETFEP